MQKVKEISLAHYQGVSSSNEYDPVCNTKMIDINLNMFRHSLPAKNTNLEIQIEYFTEISGNDTKYHTAFPPYPIHPVPELNSCKQKCGS